MNINLLVITHPSKPQAQTAKAEVARACQEQGVTFTEDRSRSDIDFVLVLGGDGTILAGAHEALEHSCPLLGVNFGHLGFLSEPGEYSMDEVVNRIRLGKYTTTARTGLAVDVVDETGQLLTQRWCLNEVAVLRTDLAHPVELAMKVDGQALGNYAADGIIVASPTGSTAYAFSAGGPVVWPDTEAIIVAPLAAHGLFTRPLVMGPDTTLEIEVASTRSAHAQIWFDGLDEIPAGSKTRAIVSCSRQTVKFAHFSEITFASRLVEKFSLPTHGWPAGTRDQQTESA